VQSINCICMLALPAVTVDSRKTIYRSHD